MLLLACYVLGMRASSEPAPSPYKIAPLRTIEQDRTLDSRISLSYLDLAGEKDELPVILLHGSPGEAEVFKKFADYLPARRRIIPDLPGFGYSEHLLPDYSIRAHARYVLELLDHLEIEKAHIVGFSMGGGVAMEMTDFAPNRIASVTMLSAIGVQEMELFGEYHLNHALHGLQLGFFWALRIGLPHALSFYKNDTAMSYARNFYDTDQRPMRERFMKYQGPMLIVHGRRDFLVPLEAAYEHHRIVPQSDLILTDDDHFMTFIKPAVPATRIAEFLNRVDAGNGLTRSAADPARLSAAMQPFDPKNLPRFVGVTAVAVVLLLAAATLISEDLVCIGAGLMAAQGRLSYFLAAFACLLGIYAGDLLLFLAGRWLGRAALARAPLRWFLDGNRVRQSSRWFEKKGAVVILASRFLPGARLPTYFAAGALKTSFWKFALYFFIACLVWTPLLVGLSMLLGGGIVESALMSGQNLLAKAILSAILLLVLIRFLIRLATWRGRRLLYSTWQRTLHWEFWSPFYFYLPVVACLVYLMVRNRSVTLFTAANPAIPEGGFIGESKAMIYQGLVNAESFLPAWELLKAEMPVQKRIEQAREFIGRHQLKFPIVIKPDAGQRGAGVIIARSFDEVDAQLRETPVDLLIQEYAAGKEFGIFYFRFPREQQGRIFAITEKRMPTVMGDGQSTLETLILRDPRAVCMARFLLDKHADRLWDVPAAGEQISLVELGTHSRGSIFLDGGWLWTEELEIAIDRISQEYRGFYFGRYDIRTPDVEDLKRGRNFKILELNGVTSEATSIYDPKNSVWTAYRILFRQWEIAFEIGAQNRKFGMPVTPLAKLIRAVIAYQNRSKQAIEIGANSGQYNGRYDNTN
jgi:membrane protein DedA with SNARE-associated domain/pimeloyl-ACP methyl ester carboxylesterase